MIGEIGGMAAACVVDVNVRRGSNVCYVTKKGVCDVNTPFSSLSQTEESSTALSNTALSLASSLIAVNLAALTSLVIASALRALSAGSTLLRCGIVNVKTAAQADRVSNLPSTFATLPA